MADVLRAGVAGAGAFGALHALKYAGIGDCGLARVYDHDPDRARRLASAFGAAAFDDYAAFIDGLDVVSIATPGRSHAALATVALAAGLHVYVEKPLATTTAEAQSLVEVARERRSTLAVGHQERVTFTAMGLLDAATAPLALRSVRRGLPNMRNRDISCVFDLMIHDLDLAALIAGAPAIRVDAAGDFDTVTAEITFRSGLRAAFEASRAAQARERTMTLDYSSGRASIDFLEPAIENGSTALLNADFALDSAARDPLGVSIAAFLSAVRGGGVPVADGVAGASAVALAEAVEFAAGLRA